MAPFSPNTVPAGNVSSADKMEPASYRILVVDDEPAIVDLILVILRRCRLTADSASSGRKAQQLINRAQYDLVISDLCMPEMDGLALLQWIKESRPEIAVILMTGVLAADKKTEAEEQGAADFLPKPFAPKQILAAIERCRQRSRRKEKKPSSAFHPSLDMDCRQC